MKQGGRYPKLIRIKLKGNRPQSQGASDKRKNEADEKKWIVWHIVTRTKGRIGKP